jgi:protease PrsW
MIPLPPPGMVPVTYQAHAGGPQQVYYVPGPGKHVHGGGGFLEAIQSKIRAVASSDKLEGFSLFKTFSDTCKRHGADVVEDYAMVGSSRTTPPVELVDTNWPRPWMFARLLVAFAISAVVLYFIWEFSGDEFLMPAIMIMGTFAVPVAVLTFIFEMNTPRNVSVVLVEKLFVIGGVAGMCMAMLEYQIGPLQRTPGPVEEIAKLLAVVLLVRSLRYKYELNGILFGCAVGAGFACFESCGYALAGGFSINLMYEMSKAQVDLLNAQQALQAALKALNATAISAAKQAVQNGTNEVHQAWKDIMKGMVTQLWQRGLLSPFCHPVWTAIAAGAFWRVKQDRPARISMFFNGRFLMAFLIPVLMHSLWDIGVTFPGLVTYQAQDLARKTHIEWMLGSIWTLVALISWYVLFTMIQQGLNQVRAVQKAQLQATLAHVEATMQPVTAVGTYSMQPQGPTNA